MKTQISPKESERIQKFLSEFKLTFGIALTVGSILNFPTEYYGNWLFLILGFTFILAGSYLRFAKPDFRKLTRKSKVYGHILNYSSVIMFGLSSILLFYTKNWIGGISFLIMLIVLLFFIFKSKKL